MTLGRDAQNFEFSVEELIKNQKTRIVLEMSEVSFVDSAGIGILGAASPMLQETFAGALVAEPALAFDALKLEPAKLAAAVGVPEAVITKAPGPPMTLSS